MSRSGATSVCPIRSLAPFQYESRTRIVFGPGCVAELGEQVRQLGCQRVLISSDPGIIAAGHTQRGQEVLKEAGCEVAIFSDVHENPTTADVEAGTQLAKQFQPDLIVGLGGGSSMDCAKGINFLCTNGGRMQDYWGEGKATQEMLPMIALPTTAGTGSETQSYALISDARTHAKMACGDKKAAFRIAMLDPELTLTQPAPVSAATGIDAMAHALESYVSKRRNPISLVFSREAWQLISQNLVRVLEDPQDVEARAGMQLGACFAGLAIENSMLGAAHALSNPLTAKFGLTHGRAVGLMLPHVIRFNGVEHNDMYRDLLAGDRCNPSTPDSQEGAEGLARFVADLMCKAGLDAESRSRSCQIWLPMRPNSGLLNSTLVRLTMFRFSNSIVRPCRKSRK